MGLRKLQGRNMVYGLGAQSPKYDWDQGSGLRRMGSGITRLLSLNQGSDLLHGLKISYYNIFPHNKVCVHDRISWPRYISYSCFRLAAVPVIRSTGCLTKTSRYHILNLLIVEGTVIWISSHFSRLVTQLLNAPSTPEGRESDLYISFFRGTQREFSGKYLFGRRFEI